MTNLFFKHCALKTALNLLRFLIKMIQWAKVSHVKAGETASAETVKCCSCCQGRAKVRHFKLSLTTVLPNRVYTLCLIMSSWHCSFPLALRTKITLWNSSLDFFVWLRRAAFEGSDIAEIQSLQCHGEWGVTGACHFKCIHKPFCT